ncbi:MAG: lysine--tRNA ligase, partial [Flavobacteriales bacterium]|nr:lysine--tRNA ligase [Flavobacteriales bacterium]
MQLSEQEKIRRESLEKLKAYGIEPFPQDLYPVEDYSSSLISDYIENKAVCVAGRLMRRKIQGKASFG